MNLGNGGCARSREEIDRESYFHGMWMEGGKKSPLLCFSRLQIFFLPPFPPRRIHELFFRSRRVTFLSGFMPIFFRRFFRPLPFIISPLCLLFSTLILVKSPQFVSLPTSIFAPFLPPASLLYCFLFVLIYEARDGRSRLIEGFVFVPVTRPEKASLGTAAVSVPILLLDTCFFVCWYFREWKS